MRRRTMWGVVAYDVYRDGGFLDSVGGATLGYVDRLVTALTSYQYEVFARDAAGNVSVASDTVPGMTASPSCP